MKVAATLSILILVLKNGSLVQEKLDNAKAAIEDWVKVLQEGGAAFFPAPPSCGIAGPLSPDAISCLGAFRTPASGACGEISVAALPASENLVWGLSVSRTKIASP
jgi:hypothetical protein